MSLGLKILLTQKPCKGEDSDPRTCGVFYCSIMKNQIFRVTNFNEGCICEDDGFTSGVYDKVKIEYKECAIKFIKVELEHIDDANGFEMCYYDEDLSNEDIKKFMMNFLRYLDRGNTSFIIKDGKISVITEDGEDVLLQIQPNN